jgi:hypothetical protein
MNPNMREPAPADGGLAGISPDISAAETPT